MIDLDSFESLLSDYEADSSLYITFGTWLCRGKITYVDFQKLSKWTNCYDYILPFQRSILPELSDYLYFHRPYNLFFLALCVSHIEANFSQEQQFLLLKALAEGTGSRMEKSPQGCGTLTADAANFDLLTDETHYAD